MTVDVMPVDAMAALWTRSCEGFLYLVKGSMSDPGIAASIPTGLPLRSGALVICWRQFGTYCWALPGLGWNDDGTPL